MISVNKKTFIFIHIFIAIGMTFILLSMKAENEHKLIESENIIFEMEMEIDNLHESKKSKENKILNLESKIESISENLIEKEDLIWNLNNKLEDLNNKLEIESEKYKELQQELSKYEKLRKLNIVATAYTSECNGCIGITSTGYDVRKTIYKNGYRVVATDPNVVAMGSLLYVETQNESFVAISTDTGSAIKGNRMDVLVENKSTAFEFGKQNIKVTVLREGGI